MARIAGIDLPNHKRIDIALTSVYGIGRKTAVEVVKKAGLDLNKKARDLSNEEWTSVRRVVEEYTVEGDLRREISMNIKMLVDLNSYRGIRHRLKLPVRGQRTKTNARTRKGPRKTVAGKKKAPK